MPFAPELLALLPTFLTAAENQSFSRAARQLGVSPAAVSKNIRQLERHLDRVLFIRNTHQVVLTPEGAALYERVAPAWQALGHALEDPAAEPGGTVRLSVIPGFGRHRLMPLLADFQAQYPQIRLDILLETRYANLLTDRVDVAIGHSPPEDARIISRPLPPMQALIAASPDYLAAHGTPHSAADLSHHRCLLHRQSDTDQLVAWPADLNAVAGQRAWLMTTSPDALVDAALAGMGIICLADWHILPHLASGRLQQILSAEYSPPRPMWVKYASHRLAPRVRVLVDFLMQQFNS